MNIFLKRCNKWGRDFDIGINYDVCPECRYKKEVKENVKRE